MLHTVADTEHVVELMKTKDTTLALVTPPSDVKILADALRSKFGDQIEVFTDPGAPQSAHLNPSVPVGYTVFEARTIGRRFVKPGKLTVFVARKADYPTLPQIIHKAYWIEASI